MFKLLVRNLLAHKFRFLLTAFSVVLGVGFVVGSFVLTDSLRKSFDEVFDQATSGLDLAVRAKSDFDNPADDRAPMPEALLDVVRAIPGVDIAAGEVSGYAQVVGSDGKPATTQGAPLIGTSWTPSAELSALRMSSGKPPVGPHEIVVDTDTATSLDIAVGDRVTVLLQGPSRVFRVSGIASFGEKNQLAGARITSFDLETAQEVLGNRGTLDGISVATTRDGDVAQVRSALAAALPSTVEVVTRQKVIDESLEQFSAFVDVFGTALLGFAAIALFVSAFVITNTFTIIVGQRTRELALLRAIGATPAQVRAVMMGEALTVGVVATVLGLGVGLLIAQAIRAIFDAGGAALPDSSTVIAPRTIVVALVVGIGVTVVAALLPARKASRISPMEAMNAGLSAENDHARSRVAIAVGITLAGAAGLLNGLFISDRAFSTWLSLGAGSMLFFIGVAALSAFVARPIAHVLGFLYPRLLGMTGVLARENAARNPSRTASAASALMIGLALVSMVSVIGNSIKATVVNAVRDSTRADFLIQSDSFTGFSSELAKDLGGLAEIRDVGRLRVTRLRIDGDTKQVAATDAATLGSLVDLDLEAGSIGALVDNGILVHHDPAADLGLSVGDTITGSFPATGNQRLRVAGIYGDASLMGNWIIDMDTYEANAADRLDFLVFARINDGVDPARARSAIESVTDSFPQTTLRSQQEYRDNQEAQLDQFLAVVNALLGLAIIIALLGIVNTLALSVIERTRELGLLRAVGMTRRQVRRMVRWEAVLISVFGGLTGTAIGILFGVALGTALPDSLVKTVSVPGGQLVGFVVIAGLFGLFAGSIPARRAAKLDILTAMASA